MTIAMINRSDALELYSSFTPRAAIVARVHAVVALVDLSSCFCFFVESPKPVVLLFLNFKDT
jgi:hypothetical protein